MLNKNCSSDFGELIEEDKEKKTEKTNRKRQRSKDDEVTRGKKEIKVDGKDLETKLETEEIKSKVSVRISDHSPNYPELDENMLKNDDYWANIYLSKNGKNIAITDLKLKEGYMWDEKTKLWKKFTTSAIKRDISLVLESYIDDKITELDQQLMVLESTGVKSEKNEELQYSIEFFEKQKKKYLQIKNTVGIFNIICSKSNPEFESKLNSEPHMFSLANGKVINLKTKEVRDRRREDFITVETEVNYNVDKESKEKKNVMEKFMLEIACGDEKLVRKFQKSIGKYLTGESADAIDVWYGKGSGGKSSSMWIIRKIMGKYGTGCIQNILYSPGLKGCATPNLMPLIHARLVFYGPYGRSQELDTSIIESFTNGEKIVAHRPHGSEFSFIPKFKILMESNHEPTFYRHNLYPFDAKFPWGGKESRKGDDYVKDLMDNHLDEIFEWMVEGAHQYYQDSLLKKRNQNSNVGEVELKNDMDDFDIINQFVTDNCIVNETMSVSQKDLKERYIEWRDNTTEPILYSDFKKYFSKIYQFKKGTTGIRCHGIGWKDFSSSSGSVVSNEPLDKKTSIEEKFLYKLLHLYVDTRMLELVSSGELIKNLKNILSSIRKDFEFFFIHVDSDCYINIFGEEILITQELEDYYFSLSKGANTDSLSKITIRYKKEIFDCLLKKDLFCKQFKEEKLYEKITRDKMFEICKQLLSIDNIVSHKYPDAKWINDHPIFITYYLSRVKEFVVEFFPFSKELNDQVYQFIDDMENIISKSEKHQLECDVDDDISDDEDEDDYEEEEEDDDKEGKEKKGENTIEICRKLFYPKKPSYYSSLLSNPILPKDLMKIVISYMLSISPEEIEEFLLNFETSSENSISE